MNAIHLIDINRSLRSSDQCCRDHRARPGFSITEMLVVVGIIVLLASLLMVAMGRVRDSAMTSQTLSIMQNFAASCDAFQTDHGTYPGVIPERVLATEVAQLVTNNPGSYEGPITFTSTENALLHMMGGYRVLPPGTPAGSQADDEYADYPFDYEIHFGDAPNWWRLKVRLQDIGQGPIINGKPYPSYYTPGTNEVAVATGQYLATDDPDPDNWVRIPDLIDAWGQPIIYVRQIRTTGPLVGDPATITAGDGNPQFLFGLTGNADRRFGGMSGYLLAGGTNKPGLGEFAADQIFDATNNPAGSILNDPAENRLATFAQIIRNPAFGPAADPLLPVNVQRTAARGAYVLISAGRDGIFFSAEDGPGTSGAPETNIVNHPDYGDPRVVAEYNDVIFFGGG